MLSRSVITFRLGTAAIAGLLLLSGAPACAGEAVAAQQSDPMANFHEQVIAPSTVNIANGPRDNVDLHVVSWRDIPFQTVKRQALDYSCGSAAVATLLSYIYDQPVSEAEVFHAMFAAGDQDKIRHEGFSMADIRSYLATRGLNADGYRLSLDTVEQQRIPFIALIQTHGYNHFVVAKSIRGDVVLVGDPIRGNMVYRRADFLERWNGIALIVKNNARFGRALFGSEKEWRMARTISYPSAHGTVGMDSIAADHSPWQMERAGIDVSTQVLSSVGQVRSATTSLTSGGAP